MYGQKERQEKRTVEICCGDYCSGIYRLYVGEKRCCRRICRDAGEQVVPLVVMTAVVSLVKVAVLAGGVMMLRRITVKIKK